MFGLIAAGIRCNGQAPQFIEGVPIGESYFGLVIQAGTNGWVSLDASSDLDTWSELASIATTNATTLFVDEANVQAGTRFYRLRLPGTAAEDAKAHWMAKSVTAYRFQLERVSTPQSPYVLFGTVTVTNGQKSVTNATADGQSLNQPDPTNFPSIGELFGALSSAQLAGCRQVYADYDPLFDFPIRCFIDQRIAAVPPADQGNALEYRVSAFEILEQSASAKMKQRIGSSYSVQKMKRALSAAAGSDR